MDADIIKFPFRGTPVEAMNGGDVRPSGRSVTAKNKDLRQDRQKAWRKAAAAVNYWRHRLDFEDAVRCAQDVGLPEGCSHTPVDFSDRSDLVEKYRAALVKQLLTPAPKADLVKWKQAKLASERDGYWCLDVKPERIERSIAED